MKRALALAVAAVLLATPALALAQTPQQPQTLQPTSNWSGYVATNAYYTGVSALIQAPLPNTVQSLGVVSSWVGIGGSSTQDLIQTGIDAVEAGPFFAYRAWYELLPELSRNVVLEIQPGAWVSIDVHE